MLFHAPIYSTEVADLQLCFFNMQYTCGMLFLILEPNCLVWRSYHNLMFETTCTFIIQISKSIHHFFWILALKIMIR